MEFKEFSKILNVNKGVVTVTQKLHGTNASIWISKNEAGEFEVKTGSRTRFITVGDDNFGFARFVEERKQAFIDGLGEGTWFGEFVGPGINSGEGLTERRLALFAVWKQGVPLPSQVDFVPVLFKGSLANFDLETVLSDLKSHGSVYKPGFMRPEGVVVDINGTKFKSVFDVEETKWTSPAKPKGSSADKAPEVDVSEFLHPIRMEKLLSRDERFISDFPDSLPKLVAAYLDDLTSEGFKISEVEKPLRGQVFKLAKESVNNYGR